MCRTLCFLRVKQVEEENSEMTLNMSRLKSHSEKLDEVSHIYSYFLCSVFDFTFQGVLNIKRVFKWHQHESENV